MWRNLMEDAIAELAPFSCWTSFRPTVADLNPISIFLLHITQIRPTPWQYVLSFLLLSKLLDRLCPDLASTRTSFPSTSTTGIMAEILSRELFVSKVLTTAFRQTNAVLASVGADPVKDQEPAPQANLSRSFQSLQQWEVTTVDVLRACQKVQGSRPTTAPILHELDFTKQVVDRRNFKQMSSEEVQHPVAQSPSGSQGTKRRRELELEPPTSKHARKHTNSKQPRQQPLRPLSTATCQRSLRKAPTVLNIPAQNTCPLWRRAMHSLLKRQSQTVQLCTHP